MASEKAAGTFSVDELAHLVDLRSSLRRDEGKGAIRQRARADIRFLVIHHSAVAVDSSAEAIANYHIDRNGWPGIGYHFLIHWDGRSEYVADISEVRYNVASRNHEVVGVCLVGNWMAEPPPSEALRAARLLALGLQMSLGWEVPVVGHRDVALPGHGTACPGDSWDDWRPAFTPDLPIYTVQPGDTLWGIARRFDTSVAALAGLNRLADHDLIVVGQRLIIRQWATKVHRVEPGDTLSGVARRYGVTVPLLLRLNPGLTSPDLIHPGEELVVP